MRSRTAVLPFLAALALGGLLSTPPLAAVKRRAFVTSTSGSGALGGWAEAGAAVGLAAGDTICRARAADAGLPNFTAYRAWLSDATTDAHCHVQGLVGKKATGCGGVTQPGGGPWYLVNGVTPFTGTLAELDGWDRKIYRPVLVDEFGAAPPDPQATYWTGTDAAGRSTGEDCSGWTNPSSMLLGESGHALASAVNWTQGQLELCNIPQRLLCLEPGASEELVIAWQPAAIAFVTSAFGPANLSVWPWAQGATGSDAGDATCRALAATAHLPSPDSFVAWLSDETRDARDAVHVEGQFRRVDGYPIAYSRADLLDGVAMNSLHVEESGEYLFSSVVVHTGTDAEGVGSGDDCLGWTSASADHDGTYGLASFARTESWTDSWAYHCDVSRRLYCFSNVVTIFWDGFELTGDVSRWSAQSP